MAEVEELKNQIESMNETVNHAHQFHSQLNDLHDQGLLKQDDSGTFHVVDDHRERAYLKEQISSKKKQPPAEVMGSRRQAQQFGPAIGLQLEPNDDDTLLENLDSSIQPSAF